MPKNKLQGFIFGLIMSYAMAYGMEVYNVAIREGVLLAAGGFSNMTNLIFWEALKETSFMGLLVLLISNLWETVWVKLSPPGTATPTKTTHTFAVSCAKVVR